MLQIHLHPALVHFPIALLLVAAVAGLLYLHGRPRAELRVLTWWPMLLGWIATAVAILTGLLDQRNLPPDAPFRPVLNWHIGTGLALFVVYGWILYQKWLFGGSKAQRRRMKAGVAEDELLDWPGARWWLTGLLLLGSLLVVASGWNGGRLVYEWAVNVARP